MKQIALAALLCGLALPAAAQQTSLLTASPIPEGAEKRFCYYGGLAYSREAYILVSEGTTVAQVTGVGGSQLGQDASAMHSGSQMVSNTREKLLQCVADSDGILTWTSVAGIQIK